MKLIVVSPVICTWAPPVLDIRQWYP